MSGATVMSQEDMEKPYVQAADGFTFSLKGFLMKLLARFVSTLLIFLAFFLYGLAEYYSIYTLEQILFHLVSPQETVAADTWTNLMESTLPNGLTYAFAFFVLCFFPIPIKVQIDDMPKGIQLLPFPWLTRWHFLISLPVFFYGTFEAVEFLDVPGYLERRSTETSFYQDYYVFPEEQDFVFPETKQNLIFIFLESFEATFGTEDVGGHWPMEIIPHLTEYSREHISFSDTGLTLGSGYSATGTTWTAASIVGTTTGLPYKYPLFNAIYEGDADYLPGVTGLGEILEEHGYRNYFLMGSDSTYAARDKYLTQHGNYEIYDLFTAIEDGRIPESYFANWGFEDQKLFAYAKEQLTEIATDGEPFNYTMLTADTHFPYGYRCELCPWLATNLESVVSCNDAQLYEFISWVQEQDFYENTTIILLADHLFMQDDVFETYGIGRESRMLYNCIINPVTTLEKSAQGRHVSNLDFFPTTLGALGVTWGDNRLGLGTNLFTDESTLIEEMGFAHYEYQLELASSFYTEHFFVPKK